MSEKLTVTPEQLALMTGRLAAILVTKITASIGIELRSGDRPGQVEWRVCDLQKLGVALREIERGEQPFDFDGVFQA